MATPATLAAPNPSTATPVPPSALPRDLSSLRNTDSGPAFRGPSKARGGNADRGGGRGGNRNGRGGRGANGRARGSTEPNTPKTDSLPLKVEVPVETKPSSALTPSSSISAEKPATPTAAGEKPKPKIPSRRGSRNVPAVAIAPPSPTVESPTSAARPKPIRKRSNQGPKSAAPAVRQSLTIDAAISQSSLRPQKARTGPPTPTIVKDVPPHLSAAPDVATFDMKHDIDALVDRMRAAAMSDSLRPSTPGSHIDWAGDDDDSLPDLNDWGVTTSYSKNVVEMSPIMVDNLKPLPGAVTRIKNEAAADQALTPPTEAEPQAAPAPAPPAVSSQLTKGTLHPSLPAKPVASLPKSSEKHKGKVAPVPVRVTAPPAQSTTPADKLVTQLESSPATAEEVPLLTKQPIEIVAIVKLPPSTASENSPSVTTADFEDTAFAVEKKAENIGLSASMHAPSPSSDSASLPNSSSANPLATSLPTGPRNFQPSHQRAHTVGRPHQIPPISPPAHQRFPRANGSSPRGGYHNRTHSSPPAGAGSSSRGRTSRPILTNGAISNVLKNMGGGPPAKAREVATTTE